MAKAGRPRKAGRRTKGGRLVATRFVEPNDAVKAKRETWSFVTPTKGPDGRVGEIDQDVCDGIGQFHALGLLDGHGIEAMQLRDAGREWRNAFVLLMRGSGFKVGGYERSDKGRVEVRYTGKDAAFDRADEALTGFERSALMSLLIDPVVGSWPDGETEAPWVRGLIAEGLLKRSKVVPFAKFPDANDRELLNAAIRGLCCLVDATLPNRWERSAA